jgi:hypothetical protein
VIIGLVLDPARPRRLLRSFRLAALADAGHDLVHVRVPLAGLEQLGMARSLRLRYTCRRGQTEQPGRAFHEGLKVVVVIINRSLNNKILSKVKYLKPN